MCLADAKAQRSFFAARCYAYKRGLCRGAVMSLRRVSELYQNKQYIHLYSPYYFRKIKNKEKQHTHNKLNEVTN